MRVGRRRGDEARQPITILGLGTLRLFFEGSRFITAKRSATGHAFRFRPHSVSGTSFLAPRPLGLHLVSLPLRFAFPSPTSVAFWACDFIVWYCPQIGLVWMY